jgi:hypothetical protein
MTAHLSRLRLFQRHLRSLVRLLTKYNMTECNPNKVPLKTAVNLDEITSRFPRTPHPEVVSLYDQLIGELMFITINIQSFIAQPVNALTRFMTTANSELYVFAKECYDT